MTSNDGAALVIPLSALDATSLPLAGGKAAQLGVMMRAGLPVPDGFCVTTEAYTRRESAAVRDAICAAYRALGGRVAVRSSATAEDLPDASFAGQQDTFLNVDGEDAVLDAVARCRQSLFTERAIAYRRDRNIADESVRMAVVVQRMVDADAAGVLFTINPVTGALDELVIEAAPGLGDKVVSAQVTPDQYRVRRRAPNELIQRQGDETARWLTPPMLTELARLGLNAERLLGCAADVEWAIAAGRVYLLQARAVTAAGPRVPVVRFGSKWNEENSRGKLIFWGNYNLRDTMPYPHTPLSWSFWNYLITPAMLRACGIIGAGDLDRSDEFLSMGDLVDGRIYFNMNMFQVLMPLPKSLAIRLGTIMDAELAEILPGILRGGEFARIKVPWGIRLRWLRVMLRPVSAERAWRDLRDCHAEVEHYSAIDVRQLTEEQIIATARFLATENIPKTLTSLLASGPSLTASWLLSWLLPLWGLEHLQVPLMAGVRGNPTLETALAMWDVAAAAGPEVRAVFAREEIARVSQALESFEAGRRFRDRMDAFLREHGHRAVREFDFSCPRWKDDPTFVYETVRNYLQHPPDQQTPRQHYDRQVAEHENAKRTLEEALRHRPLRRLLARRLMRVIETRMPLREAFKFYMLYGLARVRELLLEIGRRLVDRGVLQQAEDFMFLTIPEAEKIAAGQLDAAWIREEIPLRRREFAQHMRTDPPLIVRSDGKPVIRPTQSGELLKGAAVSPGVVRGPARVLFDPSDGALLHRGDILVARFTDPGWTPLFLTAGGLVMEVGGIISHGAVVAREYGIPAVIGIRHATRILHDGEMLEVNGSTGEVRRLEAAAAAGAC